MRARAVLSFETADADVIRRSLEVETRAELGDGRASLACDGELLTLEIITGDIPSLRASLNSYLRWMETTGKTLTVARMWKDGDVA